ncbi:hypothetical protein [Kribbella sp. NPDC048928]|uniref:hypothetical protein n=1 Tax=Kribbella sp. NPDC048928 TaxID=3364111 RepID=UPI003710EA8D
MTTPPPPHAGQGQVLPFPQIDIVLNDDRPRLVVAGAEHPLTGQDLVELRENAIKRIAQTATALGRPVRVTAYEAESTWPLIIHPDGTVTDGSHLSPPGRPRRQTFRRRR